MKVAIQGGKIQRGGVEGAGEDGAGEDGAGEDGVVPPRRDAAEPAFPNARCSQAGALRQSYGKGRMDRQAWMDREQGYTDICGEHRDERSPPWTAPGSLEHHEGAAGTGSCISHPVFPPKNAPGHRDHPCALRL